MKFGDNNFGFGLATEPCTRGATNLSDTAFGTGWGVIPVPKTTANPGFKVSDPDTFNPALYQAHEVSAPVHTTKLKVPFRAPTDIT